MAAAGSRFGKILVDRRGDTPYAFAADKTSSATCYSSSAQLWPPLLTSGAPTAGAGSDKSPGDITGQAVNSSGGLWYVLSPTGSIITTAG